MSESQGQAQNGPEPPGRPWSVNELLPDVTRLLSRSATIALLLSPVGLILIAVIRLSIICDYNIPTALAVASSGGYVNTLLGTILPIIPIVLPYLALILLFFNRVLLGSIALLATLLISPVAVSGSRLVDSVRSYASEAFSGWPAIPIGILAVIVAGLLAAQLGSLGFSRLSRSVATIICVLLIPVAFLLYPLPSGDNYYAHLVRQPWLPAESITLTSGGSLIGYIIAEDDDWVTVLTDQSRQVRYFHPDQIATRTVCQLEKGKAETPLISLIPAASPSSEPPQCDQIAVSK
jgi:hypothetical protein